MFFWVQDKQPAKLRKIYGVKADMKSFQDEAKTLGGGTYQCKVMVDGTRKSERGTAFDIEYLPEDLVSEAIRLVS